MKLYELTTERMNELDAMITAFSAEGCREVYEYVGQNALKVFNLKEVCDNAYVMSFDDEDGNNLLIHVNFASQILLRDENERLHPKIAAHKKRFSEWEAKEKTMREQRYNPRAIPAAPHHVCCASSACSPRVWRMVGTLISAMEPLGWEVTDDLDFVLNGDAVRLIFSESQDKINHIPTKEENLQLLKYQDDLRKRSYWATKPQIRKYDYEFNGKLYVTINGNKTFRDCKSYKLEDRLGDIMLEMYAAAEKEKQKRLAREEAERKRKEEERRQEERRKWYNAEVDRTNALANAAEDYALACKIRDYIAAYASSREGEDISEWLAWANAKADWFDPTVAAEDELFGKRKHNEGRSEKVLKHIGYW